MLKKAKRQGFSILFLLFFVGVFVFARENQSNTDNNKLKEKILEVYKHKGEDGLRDFVKEKIDNINPKFIISFAEAGFNKRKKDWLKISLILAEEKKNELILAFVHFEMVRYFYSIGDYDKGIYYYEKALPVLKKFNPDFQGYVSLLREANHAFRKRDVNKMEEIVDRELKEAEDIREQANIYIHKGELYAFKGDNVRALEMYEKAMSIFVKEGDIDGQGNVYLSKGNFYGYTGNYRKGLDMYDNALLFFKNAGNLDGQGEVYRRKGDINRHAGEDLKALEMYDKALQVFEITRNVQKKAQVYMEKGVIYRITGKHSKALDMYNRALSFFEIEGTPRDHGNVYMSIGGIYLDKGENARALEMNERALHFFKEANDLDIEGVVYAKNARIYFETGDITRALEMCEKALNIYKRVENSFFQGIVSIGIGDIYSKIGNRAKALEVYDKALCYYDKVGYLGGQSLAFFSKGEIYSEIYDYPGALKMYYKALDLAKKTGDINFQGYIFSSIGCIYLSSGDYSRAMEMFKKAEVLINRKKDAMDTIRLVVIYGFMGNTYFMRNDYSRAMEMYKREQALIEEMGDNIGMDSVYLGKGDIYFWNGDYYRAMEMYKKALPFYKRWHITIDGASVHSRMGDIYFWTGDYSKAMEMYETAIPLQKKIGSLKNLSYTLFQKAQVLEKLGKNDEAFSLFEEAIGKLEKIRARITFPWLKKTFMEKVYGQYHETALFMLENKYNRQGFRQIESMRARVFSDQMAEGLKRVKKGISAELMKKRDGLVARLSLISKEISQVKDEGRLKKLKKEYQKTGNEFEDLLVKIRLENPLYASVQYPEPVSLKEIRKKVLKKDEILVEYFVSEKDIYVFLVSGNRFKVLKLEGKAGEVSRSVNRYLLSSKDKDAERLVKYGNDFYRLLFKPLEAELKNKNNLIIAPGGELAKVPFESFVIDDTNPKNPTYLLEKYRIKYIQSATVLGLLRKYYKREGRTKNFIGFGDPVYDYKNFEKGLPEQGRPDPGKGDEIKEIHRGKYDRDGGVFDRLPGSGREVEAIADFFKRQKAEKCVVHLREKATEMNAKAADMKRFDYIHFSCHGILGDGFQSLVLSQGPGTKEDGYLTLNELMNCDYHARLVVLSACKTGSGKMERGEGVTGLTRAVMYAGTPAVVASLWNVSEMGTRELMVKFYRNMLVEGMSKEEALRRAKLEMTKGEKYASPYFWSAFVMYGE